MAVKTFLTVTTKSATGATRNARIISPRRVVPPQAYRRTENPAPQNRDTCEFAPNIVPFRHLVYRPLAVPIAAYSSTDQLRFRIELHRLAYGAGMFALGILAHMAWLDGWS
jgi:hypothetical protein